MKVRVAAVSAEAFYGPEEYRNAERALKYVDEAASIGAQLICFPEGYPGPFSGPMDFGGHLNFNPIDALRDKARQIRVYISVGELEPNPEVPETFFVSHKLISPEGDILANYRRVQPSFPGLKFYLTGGKMHVAPGEEILVVDTGLGRIGLQVGFELWVPEISRVQMLKGAEIILCPVSGVHSFTYLRLSQTWRSIVRARATENLLFVVVAQSVFLVNGRNYDIDVGCVTSPEEFLAISEGPGIMVATLNMERLHLLRTRFLEQEYLAPPKDPDNFHPVKARPGQNHHRRPELYHLLCEPQEDAFDYSYFLRGLEAWRDDYQRLRMLPRPGKVLR